jgi:glycosyltransferase involved in cell wall biosynthesis/tetratricopeptide (TPR) repeat protein
MKPPNSRNDPCPCGSGKRYKSCHGISSVQPSSNTTPQRPQSDVYVVLNQALAAQTAGKLAAAEKLYRAALEMSPQNFDALHMLGVVLLSTGRTDAAIDLLKNALAIFPGNTAAQHNLGLALENRAQSLRLPLAFEAIERAARCPANPSDRKISSDDVQLIAYYLPQFHRIPENDAWWGEGFTEWTNVSRAKPNYDGHYQPHRPGELGAYDLLRDPTIRERQAELAKAHGISGFAYYHYWFQGKRLLEQPLELVLRSKQPDFPFCVFWANESWSRRWDGGNQEVLVQQHHDAKDDKAFIEHLLPYFEDPRYIRVNGRPLLMIYRVELFPNARATAQLWAEVCRAQGISPPYLVKADTGLSDPPQRYGFDASVEFPPHRLNRLSSLESQLVNLTPSYTGAVFDMRAVIAQLTSPVEPPHRHFQCVVPAWDNTARKQLDGTMFVGERAELFRAWTRNALVRSERVHPPGERMVFVNAWNEWAEGAHLEPCEKFGRQWLEAARDARSIPAAFQPIERLTDDLLQAQLSQREPAHQTTEELLALSGALVRRDQFSAAIAVLRVLSDRPDWLPAQSLSSLVELVDRLPPLDRSDALAQITAARELRARARSDAPQPLVSVLVPSYGHSKYVGEALRSVLAQTYRHIELIVIDDGSTDDSVSVIESTLANASCPVQFIARQNLGAHATINEALALAKGTYVNVLNSDDCFHSKRIERFVDEVHTTGAIWGYATTQFIDEHSQELDVADPRVRPLLELFESARGERRQSVAFVRNRGNPTISTGNLFVATEFMQQVGGFTNLRYVHDWAFCLSAVLREEPIFVDEPLYQYRFHGKNTILENESAASAEATKVIADYYASADIDDAVMNPLAWSHKHDGARFTTVLHSIDRFARVTSAQFKDLLSGIERTLVSTEQTGERGLRRS